MHTEHLLPSTRIRASRYAGQAARELALRAGLSERSAHILACKAAGLVSVASPEMAIDIINARIKSREARRHV